MRVHLALDGIGGAALALAPQFTGARRRGKKHWLPHLAIGMFEIGMAVLTKPEPQKPQSTREKNVAKLVATAKLARDQARRVADAVVSEERADRVGRWSSRSPSCRKWV